jgi:hypothetical protein
MLKDGSLSSCVFGNGGRKEGNVSRKKWKMNEEGKELLNRKDEMMENYKRER